MNTAEETMLTPADLDAAGDANTYPHKDPALPFPLLDEGLNRLIVDATRHFYYYKKETKSKGDYFLQEGAHAFSCFDESTVKRLLLDVPGINRERLKNTRGEWLTNTMIDYCLLYIARYKSLKALRPLISGHRAGIDTESRTLYINELQLIPPAPGEWNTIRGMIESILTEPGKIKDPEKSALVTRNQIAYFYAWCAHAVRTLYAWHHDPGALLALIGAPAAGKSFILNKLIAPMLATPRPASCAGYLAEGKFNAEWAPCALLTADDQGVIVKSAIRRQASEMLKSLLAPGPKSITGKGVDTYSEFTFWRFVICANVTNLDSLILEINGSTDDKIAALYCSKLNIPGYPNTTAEEKQALDAAIDRELPAFIYYLLHEYTCPNPAARYGTAVYRHPVLDDALRGSATTSGVLNYIAGVLLDDCSDCATFKDDVITDMTAQQIRRKICDLASSQCRKDKPPHGWGRSSKDLKATLHKLAEEQPHYVTTRFDPHRKTDLFTINFGALRELY